MKALRILPGIGLSLAIAALACWLESLLPIHVIGSAVIAMFIGMIINFFLKPSAILASGLKFTSKKILKFAIILLGLSLNITTILNVGRMSLTVMIFTLLTCFGGGYFIGKALGLNWKLSNLISAGTGICGGSAIACLFQGNLDSITQEDLCTRLLLRERSRTAPFERILGIDRLPRADNRY